jgi:hypothetical protein
MSSPKPKYLAVVQSRLTTADFLFEPFTSKLDYYLSQAQQKVASMSGSADSDVIVLFPGSKYVVEQN